MDKVLETVVVKSRYNDSRIFLIYKDRIEIVSEFNFIRAGTHAESGELMFIDFDGGPFISINENLKLNGKKYKITNIKEANDKTKIILHYNNE